METLKQLTAELMNLYRQQMSALEDAVFTGMTDEQWRAFDERRKRISELCKKLGESKAA